MVNHHFAKFADVWKHLVLTEVLHSERPAHYGETHAGSAVNPMVEDPERTFGIGTFLTATGRVEALAASRYRVILERFGNARAWYPGSPALAMTELENDCSYLFCDRDPENAADLHSWAAQAGVRRVEVRLGDGIAGVGSWLAGVPGHAVASQGVLVHVDPFDPYESGQDGRSALDLVAEVIASGHALVYWYGYDRPERAWWPYHELALSEAAPVWCGDVMVLDADGEARGHPERPGDLGRATTPGTGSGVLLANVSPAAVSACELLGRALELSYAGATLPDGSPGGIRFGSRGDPAV